MFLFIGDKETGIGQEQALVALERRGFKLISRLGIRFTHKVTTNLLVGERISKVEPLRSQKHPVPGFETGDNKAISRVCVLKVYTHEGPLKAVPHLDDQGSIIGEQNVCHSQLDAHHST